MDTPGFGHLPPFAADDQDGVPGLLACQRELGGVPKIFFTNTAAEYWRGDGSLAHIDPRGERDLPLPAETRAYLFASAQHSTGLPRLVDHNPLDGTRGAHPFNILDATPLLRAALSNLDAWVTVGMEPPPSVVPRLDDGTAVPAARALDAYHALPGAASPDPGRVPALRPVDLGPEATAGIGRYPATEGEPYRVFVSAIDDDGNELAGLRLPDLAVPVATHTGWNPRAESIGGAGQLLALMGSTLPFAATAEARAATGDPRRALSERYRDRDDYLARVRAATDDLIARRAILAEDTEWAIGLAAERYDAIVAAAMAEANS